MSTFVIKFLPVLVALISVLIGVFWGFVSSTTPTSHNIKAQQKVKVDNNQNTLNTQTQQAIDMAGEASSIYDFKYIDIDGVEQSMEKYKGHVLIVMNVASKCGFTCVNYQQMTELYDKYGESKGLRILAFPCNQFGGQEPLTETEIKEFVSEYNVRYDMASKINVNGDNTHPLWGFLKDKKRGILGTTLVKWNFTKFLIDKKGNVIERYAPNTNPKAMEKDILQLLDAE